MVSRIHEPRCCRWWIGCILMGGVLWAQEGTAQPAAAGASGRLRPADTKAAALLEAGVARSETFRMLVDTLDRSDLVVYVETGVMAIPGQLQFATATPGTRYLRVSIRVPGLENDLLPWLAHELCHATEIAEAREVHDQASLRGVLREGWREPPRRVAGGHGNRQGTECSGPGRARDPPVRTSPGVGK